MDKALVAGEALLWLWAARVAVWSVPFRVLRRARVPVVRRGAGRYEMERVVWGLGAGSRFVPRCTCLVRALAGRWMLARHGYASEVRVGVAKAEGKFAAHAWLWCEGVGVVGGDGSEYAVLEGVL